MKALVTGLLFASLLPACSRHVPAPLPPSAPPPFKIPPGCGANLTGAYAHAENAAFRYQGTDDGRTLTLAVLRETAAEGGAEEAQEPTVASVFIRLTRSPEGFRGDTEATGFTVSGAPCPVRFATEVVKCQAQGLTLRSLASTTIDDACKVTPSAQAVYFEQVLLKDPP